jgi:hypothetical protein
MAKEKESEIKKKIKQEEIRERPVKHVCGHKDPRRCLCWVCIRDFCEICNQVF